MRAKFATLFMLLLCMILGGCITVNRYLQMPDDTRYMTVFDRYKVAISGGSWRKDNIVVWCGVDFLQDDSTGVLIDTLPIFVMDSIYLESDCLDSGLWRRLWNVKAWFRDNPRPMFPIEPDSLPDDMTEHWGTIEPTGYGVMEPFITLSRKCDKSGFDATVKMRLLDRATKEVLDKEELSTHVNIKHRTGFILAD